MFRKQLTREIQWLFCLTCIIIYFFQISSVKKGLKVQNLQSVFYHVSLIWYICQLISHIASLPQMKNVRHFWGGLFIWSRKKMVILWYWFVVDIIIEIIAIRYLLELPETKTTYLPTRTHFHDSRPTSLCSYSLIVHAWWRNSQYQLYSFFLDPTRASTHNQQHSGRVR